MVFTFLEEHASVLLQKTIEHISLTGISLIMACVIAIPLGIGIVRYSRLQTPILSAGSISQTIPCLAMLAFLVPLLGLGTLPTLIVLTFYAIYPILKSTHTGLKNVPEECIEAARGLGFSNFQRLRLVELPLAFPIIISGIRVATSMTIGITTIAAFIGAGGLGDFITQGLALNSTSLVLLGAIPTAFLALLFDYGISQVEHRFNKKDRKEPRFPRLQKGFLSVLSLSVFLVIGGFFYENFLSPSKNTIVITSKNFTEQHILSELMAQLIEANTPYKVTRKFNLGTTDIIHQALLKGAVDLYPEYTGTAYITVLKRDCCER